MLGLAYATPLLKWLAGATTPWVLTAWLSLPWVVSPLRLVLTAQDRVLNRALAETARAELVYGLCFSLGLVITRLLWT